MSVMQVLIHVQGDREAVIDSLNRDHIKFKLVKKRIWVKNCFIYLDEYGSYGNCLRLDSNLAKDYSEKPVVTTGVMGWGDRYLSYNDQVRLFNRLKKVILSHRAEYYKKTEEEMQKKKKKRDENLKTIQSVIDFENNVLKKDHKLEEQILQAKRFIENLQKDFPKSTFIEGGPVNIDNGAFEKHLRKLNDILDYLKSEDVESLHIIDDLQSPIQIEKEGKKLKIQKKDLKKLSVKLNDFEKDLVYFTKSWIRQMQITTMMRNHLRDYYGKLLNIFKWYAELFKKEAKNKV